MSLAGIEQLRRKGDMRQIIRNIPRNQMQGDDTARFIARLSEDKTVDTIVALRKQGFSLAEIWAMGANARQLGAAVKSGKSASLPPLNTNTDGPTLDTESAIYSNINMYADAPTPCDLRDVVREDTLADVRRIGLTGYTCTFIGVGAAFAALGWWIAAGLCCIIASALVIAESHDHPSITNNPGTG